MECVDKSDVVTEGACIRDLGPDSIRVGELLLGAATAWTTGTSEGAGEVVRGPWPEGHISLQAPFLYKSLSSPGQLP